MTESKFLKCTCAQCGGRIEFPADGIGQTVPCPHCKWPTELVLDSPEEISAQPRRSLKWVIAGVIILGLGVVGAVAALVLASKLLHNPLAPQRTTRVESRAVRTNASKATDSAATNVINGFSVSDVRIDSTPNTTLIYASGTIKNETDKQRFGVTVEMELFDLSGRKIGSAKDYSRDAIEPHGTWVFRALLVQKAAASARVSSIHEQE
jgi:hypothetical protein